MTALGGRLGTPQILATTDPTVIYTAPNGYSVIANITLLNRGTSAVSVKVAVSDTDTPELAEYIEWNTVIVPRGVLERTQIVMQPGRRIVVSTDTVNQVAITTYGLLTPTNVSLEGVEEVLVEQGDPAEPAPANFVEFTVVSSEWSEAGFSNGSTIFWQSNSAANSLAIVESLNNTFTSGDTIEISLNGTVVATELTSTVTYNGNDIIFFTADDGTWSGYSSTVNDGTVVRFTKV